MTSKRTTTVIGNGRRRVSRKMISFIVIPILWMIVLYSTSGTYMLSQSKEQPKQFQQELQRHLQVLQKQKNAFSKLKELSESIDCTSIRVCFQKHHHDHCGGGNTICRDLTIELQEDANLGVSGSAAAELGMERILSDNSTLILPNVTLLKDMTQLGKDQFGNPFPPPLHPEYCKDLDPHGNYGKDLHKRLLQQVPITGGQALQVQADEYEDDLPPPKIFCAIYTTSEKHATNIRAIRETWATQCDGFLAFSENTDLRLPTISLTPKGTVLHSLLHNKVDVSNPWQRIRSIWKFLGTHYLNEFDYFLLGDDDVFVLPNNLKSYITSLDVDSEEDFYAGRKSSKINADGNEEFYNVGTAGYVLSKGTLRKYVDIGYNHPNCYPKEHPVDNSGDDTSDIYMSNCLQKVLHVELTDTTDEHNRERFHFLSPGHSMNYRPDGRESGGEKIGLACCSPHSITFHYIRNPAMVRHIYSLLYHC